MLVNFPKKFPFGGKGNLRPIWAKTMQSCLMVFSLIIFFKKGSMIEHSGETIVTGNFHQKIYLRENGQFGPNLSQNYATLYLMISSKGFD